MTLFNSNKLFEIIYNLNIHQHINIERKDRNKRKGKEIRKEIYTKERRHLFIISLQPILQEKDIMIIIAVNVFT